MKEDGTRWYRRVTRINDNVNYSQEDRWTKSKKKPVNHRKMDKSY